MSLTPAAVVVVVCVLLSLCGVCVTAHTASVLPDVHRNATELVTSKGYPAEEHWVTDPDGYILFLQRIPYGRSGPSKNRPVVLLQHGVLDSSATWLLNSAEQSLGFVLADAGFDVWLSNDRGNCLSKENTHLNPSSAAFWDWDWQNLGSTQLPFLVDYILARSGASRLNGYIGHSQGTTQGFVAFSTNPELAAKVDLFVALAPVVFMKNAGNLLLKEAAKLHGDGLFRLLGVKSFNPSPAVFRKVAPGLCTLFPSICDDFICYFCGCDRTSMNNTRLPVYVEHWGCPTSVRDLAHYSQEVRSGDWQMYDFGSKSANNDHYGQETPPLFPLGSLAVDTALFSAKFDTLADPADVSRLIASMPAHRLVYHEENPTWGHAGFIWSTDACTTIYPKIVDMLRARQQT